MRVNLIWRSRCLVNEQHRNNSSYTYWEMCEISFVIWLHRVKMFLILCALGHWKCSKRTFGTSVKREAAQASRRINQCRLQNLASRQSRVRMCSLCNWCQTSTSMISVVCQKLWNVKKTVLLLCEFFWNSGAENIEKRRLLVLFEILLTDSNVVICSINCAEFYKHSCFLPNVTIYHHYNFINQYFVLCFPCAIVFFIFM